MEVHTQPTRNLSSRRKEGVRKIVKRKGSVTVFESSEELMRALACLPLNYNFEVEKVLHKIVAEGHVNVALQFPEGLLMYACIIADVIERFASAKTLILGDVTYGACCVDDFTSSKLGATLLIHYGHSCLVPLSVTRIKVLYVFVEISFDTKHLLMTLLSNFPRETKMVLMGTVQFLASIHTIQNELVHHFRGVTASQAKPLSVGETLGCTSSVISKCDALVFVADGRFHMEAAMIQNPQLPVFRYDPYGKVLTKESYDIQEMKSARRHAINVASERRTFGIILGTLGRQGSPKVFERIRKKLQLVGKRCVKFLMAELLPSKLALIEGIEAWVQVACPRLSIDWGEGFSKPVLTPYELDVMVGCSEWQDVYPMDYYRADGKSWTNYYHDTP